MIVSDLKHISQQAGGGPLLEKGLDFLRQVQGRDLEDGRISIEGDLVYALVQSYAANPIPTGNGPLFEAHRKYIDIQYVADGDEAIGWAPVELLSITAMYDAEKDAEFGTVSLEALTLVRLRAGQLAVFWPEDAHAPRLAAGEPPRPALVKKIVVKVAV